MANGEIEGFKGSRVQGFKVQKGLILLTLILMLMPACASVQKTVDLKQPTIKIPEENAMIKRERPVVPLPEAPDFRPVTEDVSPLNTHIVDVVARNTPLRDVLHVIAQATSLNYIMERDVSPDSPVNVTLKSVTADDALRAVLASLDYFYTIKNNTIVIKTRDTKIFELGHPPMTQSYSVDVGGDILGAATGGGGGSGGSSGGGGGSSSIKGSVSQTVKSDPTAYDFWNVIEKSVANLLGTAAGETASGNGVVVNRLAGTVMVTANMQVLRRVDEYLSAVKRIMSRQVLIEAKIIEVNLNDAFKFGIDWSYVSGDVSLSTAKFTNVISAASPYFRLAVTDNRFSPILHALEQQGNVRILSNPRINVMNGQTALLTVGQNQSFISKVESTTTATAGSAPITTYTIETSSVLSGMMIGMLPTVNEQGEISLTVTPITSNLVSLKEQSVGEASISLPVVDLRELSTTVRVRDGQMIILGGLISKKEALTDDQVPILGNIPGLGVFFKSRDKQELRNELVVVLQPVLVGN
jgi:MSHA type pilus biogenesis protein MshL